MTVLPWNATDGITWQSDGSWFGLVATSVQNPAAAAGIRDGDRSDIRALASRNGYTNPIAGVPEREVAWRNGHQIDIAVTPVRLPTWWPFIFRAAAIFWLLGFTTLIVVRAKSTAENRLLALFLICLALESQQQRVRLPSEWAFWLEFSIPTFEAACVFLALFANQFAQPVSALRTWVFRCTVATALTAATLELVAGIPSITLIPWAETVAFSRAAVIVPLVLPLIALGLAIQAAPNNERQRVGWVFAGFALLVAGVSIGQFDTSLGWMRLVQEVSFAAIPLMLTYAALARRMFDIGFILNRAAVFAVVSVLIVAAFVVLEWALAKWFEDASHTTSLALNAALALGIGFSMRFVHHHVDRFIDAVFFRKRHENETALRRFGREAGFISDPDTLIERTRDEVLARTEATWARILLAGQLPANDPALLAMRAWHEPLDLSGYQTSIEGDYAFPMVARGSVVGAVVCGEKRNAEHYAPDEIDALSTMAHGVGLALSDFERQSENAPSLASTLSTVVAQLATLSAGQAALIDRLNRDAT